jgi:hypothetical protein
VTPFKAHDTVWSPDSRYLAILDKVKHQFCVLYDESREDEGDEAVEGEVMSGERSRGSWEERMSEGLSFVVEEEEEEEEKFMSGFRNLASARREEVSA